MKLVKIYHNKTLVIIDHIKTHTTNDKKRLVIDVIVPNDQGLNRAEREKKKHQELKKDLKQPGL